MKYLLIALLTLLAFPAVAADGDSVIMPAGPGELKKCWMLCDGKTDAGAPGNCTEFSWHNAPTTGETKGQTRGLPYEWSVEVTNTDTCSSPVVTVTEKLYTGASTYTLSTLPTGGGDSRVIMLYTPAPLINASYESAGACDPGLDVVICGTYRQRD